MKIKYPIWEMGQLRDNWPIHVKERGVMSQTGLALLLEKVRCRVEPNENGQLLLGEEEELKRESKPQSPRSVV